MECIESATQTCGDGIASLLLAQLIGTLLTSQCKISSKYPQDKSSSLLPTYDFIVVGAGSAGSPLAAKLSSNPQWKVLLIEAGQNPSHTSDIPALVYPLMHSEQDWDYRTEKQKNACLMQENEQCVWTKGKGLGGCSSVNFMIYQTGSEKDYDEWEKSGNTGWGWKSVKPYFEKFQKEQTTLIKDVDDSLDKFINLFKSAGKELGVNEIIDHELRLNGSNGYFETFHTIKNGRRNSAARIFLSPLINRKNLHIIKNAHVGKVIINKVTKKAESVKVWMQYKWKTISASKEIILSAGSINTPQILMLSGIGPRDHLESLNIEVHQDLPVGKNLQDHLMYLAVYHKILKSNPILTPKNHLLDSVYQYFTKFTGPLSNLNILRLLSFINSKKDSKYPNLQLYHIFLSANDSVLLQMFEGFKIKPKIREAILKENQKSSFIGQAISLLKPKSHGEIFLQSTDPFEYPLIQPNYYQDPDDLETVIDGIEHAVKILKTKAFESLDTELIRFDIPECNKFEFETRDYWKCMVKYFTVTVYHPCGTAKMGVDESAVVDPKLRVKGIKNLRVADLSIMPNIVRGNTNAAAIMIGEKAADIIIKDWENNKSNKDEL